MFYHTSQSLLNQNNQEKERKENGRIDEWEKNKNYYLKIQ